MSLRTAHGRYAQAGAPVVVEALPADELPKPLPINVAALPAPLARRSNGTLANSEAAKAAGRKGGLAKAAKKNRLTNVGLKKVEDTNDFYPYARAAVAYLQGICDEYADASGGSIGPTAQSLLSNIATTQAHIKFIDDLIAVEENLRTKLDYISRSATLKNKHRQDLLACLHLANLLGQAKGNAPIDPYAFIGKLAMEHAAEQAAGKAVQNGPEIEVTLVDAYSMTSD